MFEPRGHDMMSGGFLMPPLASGLDASLLFIETSGCLPMCGHGTIGMVTFAIEHGLLRPRVPGRLLLEAPAGILGVEYAVEGEKVSRVTVRNVASYLARAALEIEVPDLGRLRLDVAYGGNFYAIIEPQPGFAGLDALGASALLRLSPLVRQRVREVYQPVHPLDPTIRGVSHVMWTDRPCSPALGGLESNGTGNRVKRRRRDRSGDLLALGCESRRAGFSNPLVHRIGRQIDAARPCQCAVLEVCLREHPLIAKRVESITERSLRKTRSEVGDSGRAVGKGHLDLVMR